MKFLGWAALGYGSAIAFATPLLIAFVWFAGAREVGYTFAEAILPKLRMIIVMLSLGALPAFLVMRLVLFRARSPAIFAIGASLTALFMGRLTGILDAMMSDGMDAALVVLPRSSAANSVAELVRANGDGQIRALSLAPSLQTVVFWLPVGAAMGWIYRTVEQFGWGSQPGGTA